MRTKVQQIREKRELIFSTLEESSKVNRITPNIVFVNDDGFIELIFNNIDLINTKIKITNLRSKFEVYLFGVRQADSRYEIKKVENDLKVNFLQNITLIPDLVTPSNFFIVAKTEELNNE